MMDAIKGAVAWMVLGVMMWMAMALLMVRPVPVRVRRNR
jgi:hypothetical protein